MCSLREDCLWIWVGLGRVGQLEDGRGCGMRPTTPEDIRAFCEALTEVSNAEYKQHGDTVNTVDFAPSKGGKFSVRIVR